MNTELIVRQIKYWLDNRGKRSCEGKYFPSASAIVKLEEFIRTWGNPRELDCDKDGNIYFSYKSSIENVYYVIKIDINGYVIPKR